MPTIEPVRRQDEAVKWSPETGPLYKVAFWPVPAPASTTIVSKLPSAYGA